MGAVRREHAHLAADLAELALEEHLPGRAEAERRRGPCAELGKLPREVEHRRHAAAPAEQEGRLAALREVKAVAEPGQQLELRAGLEAEQLLRAPASELDDDGQLIPLAAADGEGPPQEEAGHRRLDEPTRPARALCVAAQTHHAHARRGELGLRKLEHHLFQARHTSRPLQILSTQRPRTSRPAKGVALPFEAKAAGSIV